MEPHDLAVDDLVTTAQLTSLGLDLHAIRVLCRQESLRRLTRGWYAVRAPGAKHAPWEGGERWESARLLHSLQARALVRSFGGRAAASHQSAVVLLGGRLWRSDLGVVHLERTSDDHSRHRRGAVIHPRYADRFERVTEGLDLPDGYLVVPPAVAAVQVGLRSQGAGRPPEPVEALIAAEGFLHDGLVTPEELTAVIQHFSGVPGITAVRRLLADAGTKSESAGETRTALALRLLGYEFTQQVDVPVGPTTYRVDAMLDDAPVIVEFDGRSKYLKDILDPTAEAIRRALAKEKDRQDQITGLGYGMARLTWEVVGNLARVRSTVEAARRQARRLAG